MINMVQQCFIIVYHGMIPKRFEMLLNKEAF